MARQEELVELIESLTIRAERLVDQTRKLKSIVETKFTEDHLLDSVEVEDWRKSVLTLLGSADLFLVLVKFDARQVNEFLTQQLKDQANK